MKTKTLVKMSAANMAPKFRAWAEALNSKINHLGRPMTQNPTPKRNKEYQSRLHDCRNLVRLQKALRALADAHDSRTVPTVLCELKTRDEIFNLVRKSLDGSRGGYYSVIEADDYADTSIKARRLQSMIDGNAAHRAESERKRQAEQLAAEIALANIPGYFPTPSPVVAQILERARLSEGLKILEPSAGSGHIADAVATAGAPVDCCELNSRLRELLTLKGHNLVGSDFLETKFEPVYDRILMNPPFEKQVDIAHVRHAFEALKPGGILVSVMSPSWEFRSDRKSAEFREWLELKHAEYEPLPDGSFKKSGTGVSTRLVVIEKQSERRQILSDEARARIEAAQIARFAAQRAPKPQAEPSPTLFALEPPTVTPKRAAAILTANPLQLSLWGGL